jgi:hypothetical protein
MDVNPYESPKASSLTSQSAVGATSHHWLATIGLAVLSLPFLLAIPVRYWAFHIAGDWFVNTHIDADERRMDLNFMYLLVMAAITGTAIFPGLLLLYIDDYRRSVIGWLLVPAMLCFVVGLLVFALMVNVYYRFS